MTINECYKELGLNINASENDVKRAYRNMVQIYHPDRMAHIPSAQKVAEEKLKMVNVAYDTIKNYKPEETEEEIIEEEEENVERKQHFKPVEEGFDFINFIEKMVENILLLLLGCFICYLIYKNFVNGILFEIIKLWS